jgi:hypothetical protein
VTNAENIMLARGLSVALHGALTGLPNAHALVGSYLVCEQTGKGYEAYWELAGPISPCAHPARPTIIITESPAYLAGVFGPKN